MRKIFIKYNPYKVETEIKIDGKSIKSNSALNVDDKRLQEWIEDLPQILVDECNTKSFNITFNGTVLDYEDLVSIARDAGEKGIKINCEHIPAKEVKDKEKSIKHIFREIQDGPFEELKQSDLKRAFEMASSSDFEVNVVATMSAGKSTLINALLRKKLMPAKQEACTATITKIKDRELGVFRATAYDNNQKMIETHPELSITTMDKLNNNPDVSTIKVEGNIPFVDSNDISLVLVDTPGPNNSRDPEHKVATYRMLSESSKTVVLYILNATQLAVNDDNDLLNYVSESMRVGGKQSKDRFIFVVNKLDEFKKGEDNVVNAIDKVRKYLEDKGIKNPSIFPAAALPALDIRTSLQGIDISKINFLDDEVDLNVLDAINKVQRLIRNEELHLEKYSNITPSVKEEINNMLEQSRMEKDKYTEALIHTGIIPIEYAIKMYVDKYAKTAKIKNIVDTFSKKLESAKSFENIKQEITNNQSKKEKVLNQIDSIKSKLDDIEQIKNFEDRIEAINCDDIKNITRNTIKEAQRRVSEQCSKHESKISIEKADITCKELSEFADKLQIETRVKLENIINNGIIIKAQELLEEYKEKISSLAEEVDAGDIYINPFELMDGELESKINISELINISTKVESVKVGEKWVKNDDKKWYKPWTWVQEDGWYKNVYQDQKYIDTSTLAQRFFAPLQNQLFENDDMAAKYVEEEVDNIKYSFYDKFKELDVVLQKKLMELEEYASQGEDIERKLKEINTRLEWLESIQTSMNSILDI